MNDPKCKPEDYIQFLIASPSRFSCSEAERVQPQTAGRPAHDSFRNLLVRLDGSSDELWREAKAQIAGLSSGCLVLDDSTLDKPKGEHIELVSSHFSGKHRKVVRGINLLTLLWTDGDRHVPCDFRIYHKATDGLTKNAHFRALLRAAAARGLRPEMVCFDCWYASVDNLNLARRLGWKFFTRFKGNRLIRMDFGPPTRLDEAAIPPEGRLVYLPGYGQVKVFRVLATNGEAEHWATNDWAMTPLGRQKWEDYSWRIEEYHKGLKQYGGVERCQARRAGAQRSHIGLALRAFLRLEAFSWRTGISWLNAKLDIVRAAVAAYLRAPHICLPQPALAAA
jgi:DDE superfamily endonuclease